ncbi:MAG: hypothetical protein BRC34_01170 [Cyanobacteria bacterium QH_1_48_107]|nr:MAG: hypothetical protein BRC34_01170 [Cyanobacteria bacterium QH_1_48_107]PSO68051.1 MAG: hypothetical protein BRC39_00385 [Cyanobacteria bacterium QH_7_48_89]
MTRSARIAAVKLGERKKDVSQMFNISRNPQHLWLKREEQTGDCQAITQHQQGCGHQITDWKRFGEWVREHGGGHARRNSFRYGETT